MSNPLFDIIMPAFEKRWFYLVSVAAWLSLLGLDKRNRFRILILLPIALALTDQTGKFIKELELWDRPWAELKGLINHLGSTRGRHYSFPSNHAANITAAMIVLSSIYGRRVLFTSIAITIAFSRVYIGVHYPVDVIVGAAIGCIYGTSTVYIYKRYINTRAKY